MMILEDYLKQMILLLALPWDAVILTYLGYKWVKRRKKTHFLGIKVIPDHIDASSENVQVYMRRQGSSKEKAVRDVKRLYTVVRVWIFCLALKTISSPFLMFAPIFGYWGEFTNREYSTELDETFLVASAKGFSLFPFVWFPIVYGVNQYRMLDEDFPRINQRQKYLNDCKRSDYTDEHVCVLYYESYQVENPEYYVDNLKKMIYDIDNRLSIYARCDAASSLFSFYVNHDMESGYPITEYACRKIGCETSCNNLKNIWNEE